MEQPAGTDDQPDDVVGPAGERIETLLNASSVHGAAARERAEELVRALTSLYGEGLARMLRILGSAGVLEQPLWDELVADDVVAGLLLIHGLHPHDVQTRVESALESVRPYLATHGGDVELLEVTDDSVVSLRLLGHCDGCPSSSVTLELAVESAVQAAAPEVTSIQVSAGAGKPATGGAPVIPLSALRTRLDSGPARSSRMVAWVALPELGELAAGEVGGFSVSGTDLLVCRIGPDLFAFADQCPSCESTMAGAGLSQLRRAAGQPVGSGVLTCPRCRSHYDVRQAGAGIDTDGRHLTPLPLLLRDDVFTVALPAEPEPAPA
jgi:Fe-S cluster biogenesis protein NfuA/nitrite reductase/ring-hydroxylating ferredoxin subunit